MSDLRLPDGLTGRLRAGLGFEVVESQPIDPGVIHNNRLTRLVGADGRQLVVKSYFRDDRGRLEREFGAFAFLRGQGFASVPVAHMRDDATYTAVYSFEPGRTKTPTELSLSELAAVGRLAAALHRVRPDAPGADFPPAFASRSLADRIGQLRSRLAICLRAADAPDAYAALRVVVAEADLPTAIERLIAAAANGLSAAELAEPVLDEYLRFNTGDFAPHNLLIRPDGGICAIDFEFFGPEEAAALPASFLAAEQSFDLTAAQSTAFLAAYHAARDVPDGGDDHGRGCGEDVAHEGELKRFRGDDGRDVGRLRLRGGGLTGRASRQQEKADDRRGRSATRAGDCPS